eukprot:5958354-Amphidinium_carterae.1
MITIMIDNTTGSSAHASQFSHPNVFPKVTMHEVFHGAEATRHNVIVVKVRGIFCVMVHVGLVIFCNGCRFHSNADSLPEAEPEECKLQSQPKMCCT